MQEIKKVLSESYQYASKKHFEIYEEKARERIEKLPVEKQENAFYRIMGEYDKERVKIQEMWAMTPLEALQGRTPERLIKGMEDWNSVLDIFTYMARDMDQEIPDIITNKMREFGIELVRRLTVLAESWDAEKEPMQHEAMAAVSAMGKMGRSECIEPLIQLAYQYQKNEVMFDRVEEALKQAGPTVIAPVMERVEGKMDGAVEKMLLYVLATVGSKVKEEGIYKKLRTAFITMEDKLRATICLSVYGDGRAVPLLRGYLQKNTKSLSKEVFYEMIYTIKKLGGDTKEFAWRE